MRIANIKRRWLRRTAVVLALPLFIPTVAVIGAATLTTDVIEEAISVWRMK
jgi:hypothetical protein